MSDLYSLYSDLFKDVHGIRPRHYHAGSWSEDELMKAIDALGEQLAVQEAYRCELERARRLEFENELTVLQNEHGIDRPSAIRWWLEAEGFEPDHIDNPYWLKQDLEGFFLIKFDAFFDDLIKEAVDVLLTANATQEW